MIIPRPTELTVRPGRFLVGPTVRLAAGPGTARAVGLLAGLLGTDRLRLTGPGASPEVLLQLHDGERELGPQGYTLSIGPDRVVLTAAAEQGLLHGVQTLRQLLPPEALDLPTAPPEAWWWPCADIRDTPLLPWRGLLLDVARHFQPLDYLYRLVDQLALHKLNVLQLHLTDDQGWRIEIEGLPRLTGVGAWRSESMVGRAGSGRWDGVPHGGYYTRRELEDLVAFAAARGVRVLPEIELPGHVRAALAAYPQLGNRPDNRLPVWTSWGISPDILGVHDQALDFCRQVLSETMDIFPDRYLHIGGDECPVDQWRSSPEARARAAALGLDDPAQLHGWFLRQMYDHVAANGRRAVCWDESGHAAGPLPSGMVLTAWRDPEHGMRSVARGHQVVMAPHLSTYFDYPETLDGHSSHASDAGLDGGGGTAEWVTTLADVHSFDPLAGGLPVVDFDSGDGPGVLGTQAQLWTELASGPAQVEALLYPRLCALAEVAWSTGRGPGSRDFADFRSRLRLHEQRLAALGVRVTGSSHAACEQSRRTVGTIDA